MNKQREHWLNKKFKTKIMIVSYQYLEKDIELDMVNI